MSSLFNLASATVGGGHQNRNGGYKMQRSVRLRSSASAYFQRTITITGSATTITFSAWVKRGRLGARQTILSNKIVSTGINALNIEFSSTDTLNIANGTTADSASSTASTAVFRDPSAWYHIVVVIDTTLASGRVKAWVNNQQVISADPMAQNATLRLSNSSYPHTIGQDPRDATYFDGYLTEVNFIDGQALTPSSFGETNPYTGVWQAKRYTGTYGTNGFYLNFSDNSAATAAAIGKDSSGNGNNWTPNNISVTAGVTYDSMLDVPTQWADGGNGRGNYAVMNPLDAQGTATLSDANLTLASATTAHKNRKATFLLPSTGKWYWELTTASTCSSTVILGWGLQTTSAASDSQAGNANTWMAQNDANQDIFNQTTSVLSTGSAVAGGSIRQVAYDADTGKLWFGVNNSWYSSTDLTSGNPSAGTNQCMTLSAGDYFPAITCYNLTANANFGQRPFAYTPPSGFKALNTLNLPTPTILKSNQYFNAVLYSGNSGSQSITGVGFQPDFVWGKSRNVTENHGLFDAVRGVNKALYSNLTNAEATDPGVSAFNSDGFSLNGSTINATGYTYVAWNWKEGSTQGFDIVTYTGNGTAGRTISHSLGVTPKLYILKRRDTGGYNWIVQTTIIDGSLDYLFLNTTAAKGDSGDTPPTSSVFSVSGNADVNANGGTYVAYLFAEVAGFSKFGSYTGNGSTDGPFVYCGFRPRFFMIKRTDSTGNWQIFDSSRLGYNVTQPALFANGSDVEAVDTNRQLDFVSNGVKLRQGAPVTAEFNSNGATYIFAAFAEHPFKNALAR